MRRSLMTSPSQETNGLAMSTSAKSAGWGLAWLGLAALSVVATGRPAPGGGSDRAEAFEHPVPEQPAKSSVPTYAMEASRIIQKNRQECHRKGQVAPFPLETYEQARPRYRHGDRRAIDAAVEAGTRYRAEVPARFSWQNTYSFEQPLEVPEGSVLHVLAHYDNSAGNPRNPNRPPKLVKWGEGTTDEMCIGFLAVTKKGQDLTRPGEKDDLQDILAAQRKDEVERHQRAARQRAAEAKARAKAGQGE